VSGNSYKLTGDLSGDNSKIAVGTAALDDSIASQVVSDGGSAELYFTAQGTTTHLYFLIDAASGTSAWDNISVTEVTPPAVSIQMGGRQTGDNSTMFRWYADANNYITQESGASDYTFEQADGGTVDSVTGGSFTSGILQPFNFASTHASTLVAAAVSGTALTDNTTPTALPDLQSTDVNLGHSFNGTIGVVRVWAGNITEAGREGASS
jgi:hypothetical protein